MGTVKEIRVTSERFSCSVKNRWAGKPTSKVKSKKQNQILSLSEYNNTTHRINQWNR
jgi:hypothetical protein